MLKLTGDDGTTAAKQFSIGENGLVPT